MVSDGNGIRDEAVVEVSPAQIPTEDGETVQVINGQLQVVSTDTESLPGEPAASATKGEWVDYCVALGADRHYLEHETVHLESDDDAQVTGQETHEPFTIADLKDLAHDLRG
jgi:hypothetical protein